VSADAPRLRDTLTARLVLLGALTALVTVVAAGAASVGLVRSAAQGQAQATLARQADVVARLTGSLPVTGNLGLSRAVEALNRQGVQALLLLPGVTPPSSVPEVLLREANRTGTASAVVGDPPAFVEVRTVGAGDTSIVLVRPVSAAIDAVATPVLRRLGLALLIGLAMAIVAGALAARRLARPLSRTAQAARALSTGERSVRVEPAGPAEVADVGLALNGLADALQISETRQRRFLLSVSHELRTPLTAIQGYAEALRDGVVSGEEATRAGAVIESEAARLDRLMADLLALARAEADDFRIDPVDLDLVELVTQAVRAWQESSRQAGLELSAQVPGRPVPARADPVRARQVLDALVGNAVRVTPSGRPVVIATGTDGDGWPWLEVRDGGPGLADEDLPVAFDQGVLRDRYQGVRPGGSGVGLALVDRLARRMGGSARAGHAPEGGASFVVRLPPAAGGPAGASPGTSRGLRAG
jgi:two-component system sensor histidine kinase BaeS